MLTLGGSLGGWFLGAYLRVAQSLDIFESLESGDQDGHSLFGGLLLSAQAKKKKVRPRPASEEKEVEELDQGESTCC